MKRLFVAVLAAVVTTAGAQEQVITSFEKNGTITWVNPEPGREYRVEWASRPEGPWSADWNDLLGIISSNATITVSVPLFYRVVCVDCPVNRDGMIAIPAGTFTMGDTFGEGAPDELPLHDVTLSPYFIGETEVTKGEWDEVYGWAEGNGYEFEMPGSGKAPDHPVDMITWYDVVKWCNARSEKEGLTPCYYTGAEKTEVYRTGNVDVRNDWVRWDADGYRLPTEAEWERAARGGVAGHRFPWFDSDHISHARANYWAKSDEPYDDSSPAGYHPTYETTWPYTSPVGSFDPNGYGLYDMAGNVWEWCWDWHAEEYYASSPADDPRGPDTGLFRVIRGGSWYGLAEDCRVTYRYTFVPTDYYMIGFRVVRRAE